MEQKCHGSTKCQRRRTTIQLMGLIGCCLPLLAHSRLFSPCDQLRFDYSGSEGVSSLLCFDVCPPTKNAVHNRIFCCRNCPEYCARCMNCTLTNPPEIYATSPLGSSQLHPTKSYSSPTHVNISTNFDQVEMLEANLETFRQEKVEWQKKEIVYIAIIFSLVCVLVAVIALSVLHVCYKQTILRTRVSDSTSGSVVSCTQSRELLNSQQRARKLPEENYVSSSLCALKPNNSPEVQENGKSSQAMNIDDTPLKEIDTCSQCRLDSTPHTLHEDSAKFPLMVRKCNFCSELNATISTQTVGHHLSDQI